MFPYVLLLLNHAALVECRYTSGVKLVEDHLPAETHRFIWVLQIEECMPATMEISCENDDCELDMAELHYTYDMPEDVTVDDFQCPYCGQSDTLREIEI